jgi:hypothetical protein
MDLDPALLEEAFSLADVGVLLDAEDLDFHGRNVTRGTWCCVPSLVAIEGVSALEAARLHLVPLSFLSGEPIVPAACPPRPGTHVGFLKSGAALVFDRLASRQKVR